MRSHSFGLRLAGAFAASTVLGLGAAAVTASADPGNGHNPPGNNGVVKVDGEDFDSIPNNQPHVGCEFRIDFYDFDEGDLDAEVIFDSHAPTADVALSGDEPSTVFVGEDPAGGGSQDIDAHQTYTLAFDGAAHPQQGYHVRLTIKAPDGQGPDADVKHKTFWVTGCAPAPTPTATPTPTPTVEVPPTPTPTPTQPPVESPSPTATPTVPVDESPSPSPTSTVPVEETPTPTPTDVDLPDTGGSGTAALTLAAALVAGGALTLGVRFAKNTP